MLRKHATPIVRKCIRGFRFARQKMLKESRRPAHGLTGVVENVIEPRQTLIEKACEALDAGRMPQVEPVNLQALAEAGEIRLLRVSRGRVHRKPCRHDHVRTGSQQFERSLESDLDACTGDERISPAKIGRLLALRVVEIAAALTHGIVVTVRPDEGLLADVAIATQP